MKNQAFIIMQVGGKDSPERRRADDLFKYLIEPTVREFQLTAYRADLDPSPGAITPKMLSQLLESRVVIADLTGKNPNVYYELGVTHSFARPLISIADSAASLPFDTKDERVIEIGAYSETGLTYAQGEEAQKSLAAAMTLVLAEDYQPPSPVRDVAASQSLDALAPENPMAAELAYIREGVERLIIDSRRSYPRSAPTADGRETFFLTNFIEGMIASGQISVEDVIRDLRSQDLPAMLHFWLADLLDRFVPRGTESPADAAERVMRVKQKLSRAPVARGDFPESVNDSPRSHVQRDRAVSHKTPPS